LSLPEFAVTPDSGLTLAILITLLPAPLAELAASAFLSPPEHAASDILATTHALKLNFLNFILDHLLTDQPTFENACDARQRTSMHPR
jgi:hypothetical protein